MNNTEKKLFTFAICAAFFLISISQLDIWISNLFYNPQTGFYLRYKPFFAFIHKDWPIYIYSLIALLAGLWLGGKFNKNSSCSLKNNSFFFIIASFIIVPGIIVNLIFKEFWGRARPNQILEFGGDKDFSAPLVIADQCSSNCSFPSGHAALAFWTIAIALILPKAIRPYAIALAIIMGFVVSYARIAQGAHFFTDTAFSFIIVVPCVYFIWKKMNLDKY